MSDQKSGSHGDQTSPEVITPVASGSLPNTLADPLSSDSLSRRKTWVLTYGTRRTYALGYSHAHSRKLLREMHPAYQVWWWAKRESLIGMSLRK